MSFVSYPLLLGNLKTDIMNTSDSLQKGQACSYSWRPGDTYIE